MRTFTHLLALGATLAAASGCSVDLDLFHATPGEEGRLSFGYAGAAAFDCFFGCPIDRAMATGSSVAIGIYDADPALPLRARTSSDGAAVISLSASYSCSRDGEFRTVSEDEPCASDERRDVTFAADVRADRAGPFALELLDEGGRLVDRVWLEAEDPVAVELRNRATDIVSLPLQVAAGATAIFTPTLLGATGPLQADRGIAWTLDDPAIAALGSPLEDLFGSATDLVVHGVRPGTTRAVLRAGDLVRAFDVEVRDDGGASAPP